MFSLPGSSGGEVLAEAPRLSQANADIPRTTSSSLTILDGPDLLGIPFRTLRFVVGAEFDVRGASAF